MGKLKLSVDDGCASDLRLAEMMDKYGIKGVFYLPVEWHSLAHQKGYEPLSYDDALKIWEHFQIGSHTITHRHLTDLPIEEAKYEVRESREMLNQLFNHDIQNFAPPRGYTNDELTEYTLSIYKNQRLTRGPGLVHIHPDSGANDNKPWQTCVNESTEELWCHSWELDKYNLWEELDDFLSQLK